MQMVTKLYSKNTLLWIALLLMASQFSFCSPVPKREVIQSQFLSVSDYETMNVQKFGVFAKVKDSETDLEKYYRWVKLKTAFDYCIANKKDLFFPKGIYDVGERNFPFREESLTTNILKDCRGITIYGEGRGTVLMTSSKRGADVLQLNMLKNLTIKNFDITAELYSKRESGSNGVSVTNGYNNIVLDNLYIYDLPGIDSAGYIDGGKGLTMQFSANKKTIKGYLKASNITVKNSAYGFRFDAANVSDLLKEKINIIIENLDVDKAYQGFSMSFGEASERVNADAALQMKVSASLNNCQQYIRFSRVIGGVYNFKVRKDENQTKIFKDKNSITWKNDDTKSFGFLSNYSKGTNVTITGDVGQVDNKIWIGAVGSIVEPFNLKNRTENNVFNFDIAGTALNEDIKIINYKGESVHNSRINISKKTLQKSKIPVEFRSNNNTVNVK